MILKLMKTHLPWAAPSVAIVLAATGFFDSGRDDSLTEASAPQTAAVQPAPVAPLPTPVPAVVPQQQAVAGQSDVTQNSNLATSLNSLTATGALDSSGVIASTQAEQVAAREPVQDVAPEQPARVAVSPTDNPSAFFGAAQATLAAQTSCVDDLRTLTSQARVYFPSGGLSGEERGVGQARLIGLVAQECPGVKIRVEGHSDPSGNPSVNLSLSKQRAEAVISRVAAAGIDTSRFVAVGLGDAEPSTVRGTQPANYYDRRVEFSVVENPNRVTLSGLNRQWTQAACVAQLQEAVDRTKIFYSPRSVTTSASDMDAALNLAQQAAACPQARLRVVGQHSDEPGMGESIATGRLRAVAMMGALVGAGIDSGQIIIAAPSWSAKIPGQPRVSSSRLDFDVILDEG